MDSNEEMAFGEKETEDAFSRKARSALRKKREIARGERSSGASNKANMTPEEEDAELDRLYGPIEEEEGKDSLGGQLQELEDQLKAGQITQKQYDRYIMKLENPDAVINYEPSGYEKSGTEARETAAGHDEDYDEHETEEEIDKEFADDEIDDDKEDEAMDAEDDYDMVSRGLDEPNFTGRRGARGTIKAPARDMDDYSVETKKNELKQMLRDGIISPQEHDKQLREILPSINFKSAGAVRAKDVEGRRGGRISDRAGSRDMASDPPVSEAQRRAMFAAKSGKSNIGIPQSVGKEFAEADPGGHLPEKKE
jgi:hypothetical protein